MSEIKIVGELQGNGIYLEDSTKQTRAVCSSTEIASYLAECANNAGRLSTEIAESIHRSELTKFLQSARCLVNTIKMSSIAITSAERSALEFAYVDFNKKLEALENSTYKPERTPNDTDACTSNT